MGRGDTVHRAEPGNRYRTAFGFAALQRAGDLVITTIEMIAQD